MSDHAQHFAYRRDSAKHVLQHSEQRKADALVAVHHALDHGFEHGAQIVGQRGRVRDKEVVQAGERIWVRIGAEFGRRKVRPSVSNVSDKTFRASMNDRVASSHVCSNRSIVVRVLAEVTFARTGAVVFELNEQLRQRLIALIDNDARLVGEDGLRGQSDGCSVCGKSVNKNK